MVFLLQGQFKYRRVNDMRLRTILYKRHGTNAYISLINDNIPVKISNCKRDANIFI
jgi:hypothetical protein